MTYVKLFPAKKAANDNKRPVYTYNPPVDIVESKDDYRIVLDLPGFEKDDVNVGVNDGILEVNGTRGGNEEYDTAYYHYFERRHGEFRRSFRIPDLVDGEKTEAEYRNGVLTLTLPKKEEAKPYSVTIK